MDGNGRIERDAQHAVAHDRASTGVLVVGRQRMWGDALAHVLAAKSTDTDVRSMPIGELGRLDGWQPDVLVVEGGTEVETADVLRSLRARAPGASTLVLTAVMPTRTQEQELRRLGATACIGSNVAPEALAELVRRAADESPAVRTNGSASRSASPAPSPARLTRRERDVLRLLAGGATSASMASSLGVSAHTVRAHVRSLLAKLGAHSRVEAVAVARRLGLVAPTARMRAGGGSP